MKLLSRLFIIGTGLTLVSCTQRTEEDRFIDSLMDKMTLDEKLGQLNLLVGGDIVSGTTQDQGSDSLFIAGKVGGVFNVKGVESVSRLQHLAVEQGPHGIPLLVGADVVHGYETVFPIPLALSCSWDTTAIETMARISAIEATADGVNWNYSPMVDICRDPRWGRIAEGSGEDPWLGSVMAKAYVRGYQGDNMKSDSTMMACVKHFALYGAAEGGRDYNTVDMSQQRMFNYYLPPYKAAVEAGCGSLMTSFNMINGMHATADKWLIEDVLRKQWGFDGMTVTDFNSVPEISTFGISEKENAAALALKAGTDMDMVSGLYLKTLKDAIQRGEADEAMVDKACRRVLEAKMRLGLFDDPYKYCKTERLDRDMYTDAHRATAREIAAETFVLLKNDGALLPLAKKGKIALIGPLADAGNNMCGCWSGYCRAEKHESLLQAFRDAVGDNAEIIYAAGSNIYYDETTQRNGAGMRQLDRGDDSAMHREALAAAAKADIIVAAMGESAGMSGESASRAELTISDTQRDLLRKLAATGKPVVLLLFTGRPLVLDWENDNIPAILNVWFGGSEAAGAIADVVFGEKNPCGKLTATFPRSVGQIPLYYNHLMPSHPDPQDGVFNRYCSNYIDISNEPLYPFGYGLSYTTFGYSAAEIHGNEIRVNVKNTGAVAGTEIVQLYIRDKVARIARPVKELKSYQRISLNPGETRQITFTITPDMLGYYDAQLKYVCEPGDFEIMIGPDSRNLQNLEYSLKE